MVVIESSDEEKPNSEGGYKPHQYQQLRSAYINRLRTEEKLSFSEGKKRWDSSSEKRAQLAPLSVGELIKRRFVPKGTKKNPWAD